MNLERVLANSENETVKFLVAILGTANALALIKNAGGASIYIPSIETISKDERNAEIYRKYCEGATYWELRIKYNLSEKTVREIINNQR